MKFSKNHLLVLSVIAVAIATRFIPHLPNLSAITAIGIFSGAYLSKKEAVGITFLTRFISDIFIGFFSWPLMITVYAAHLTGVLFGVWIRHDKTNVRNRWVKILMSGFGSAFIFFIATNFVMLYPNYYPQTFTGLVASYTNALPFFRGTLLGDVGYVTALFGGLALVCHFTGVMNNKKSAYLSSILKF